MTAAVQDVEQRASARTSLQNQAYNAAWKRIRDKYREEYDRYIDEEFSKRGLDRRKRSTGEQREARIKAEKLDKAKTKMKQLYTDYPELRNQRLF